MLTTDSIKLLANELEGTPRHTASLLLSKRFANGWEASSTISHMSEMGWYGDGGDVDEHTRVDLRLARRFRHNSGKGMIEFLVHNVGEKHEIFDSDQLFDTRYYLRGSLQFH